MDGVFECVNLPLLLIHHSIERATALLALYAWRINSAKSWIQPLRCDVSVLKSAETTIATAKSGFNIEYGFYNCCEKTAKGFSWELSRKIEKQKENWTYECITQAHHEIKDVCENSMEIGHLTSSNVFYYLYQDPGSHFFCPFIYRRDTRGLNKFSSHYPQVRIFLMGDLPIHGFVRLASFPSWEILLNRRKHTVTNPVHCFKCNEVQFSRQKNVWLLRTQTKDQKVEWGLKRLALTSGIYSSKRYSVKVGVQFDLISHRVWLSTCRNGTFLPMDCSFQTRVDPRFCVVCGRARCACSLYSSGSLSVSGVGSLWQIKMTTCWGHSLSSSLISYRHRQPWLGMEPGNSVKTRMWRKHFAWMFASNPHTDALMGGSTCGQRHMSLLRHGRKAKTRRGVV